MTSINMKIIAFQSQGEIVKFETVGQGTGSAADGEIALASTKDELERRFQDVQDLISKCCLSVREAIKRVPPPEEVTLEFGIEVGGKAGIPFVTEGSATANFKVSVTWKAAKL